MQHQNLFVFDIETVPDTDAVPNLTGFNSPGVLEKTGGKNPFPRQPFHKVVAISFLEAEIERDGNAEAYHLRELRSGGEAGFDEKKLLQGFFGYFERLKPRLVSFNGRGFDLPVLKYRAMVHGISAPWLYGAGDKWNSYTQRYSTDWHCDLLDVLSVHGASARVSLDEVCSVLGFPGKFGTSGADVARMIDDGQIEDVRHYCETDVINTYLVYLRWMQHKGTLTVDGYNAAMADIAALIQAEGGERPYLKDFMAAWWQASGDSFAL